MNPDIFREYDIRGIADDDFSDKDVVSIGRALGTYLQSMGLENVAVGRDCRMTSDRYVEHLHDGLIQTGCKLTDIGVCPTPVLYFAARHFNTDAGIMVTASHNPPEYNGFKICIGTGSMHGSELLKLRTIIDSDSYTSGTGSLETADATTPYMDFILKDISLDRTLRVGVDAGNGTGGVVAVPVLEALKCEVHPLYCDMDGRFPNHEADPTVAENMQDLMKLVREKQLDLGIGFDGDTDRIGVVDGDGNLIYGDQLMTIFARDILKTRPGATFISEVKCSQTMYDAINSAGGRAIMWKTGHSLIKEKMKTEDAALAGEMSGHMFFADRYFGFDDAIYASCRLIEILANQKTTIPELLADIPETFTTPEIRVTCSDAVKFDIVNKVTAHFKKSHDVIDIDGARVLFDNGWGLVRASNTQPALVLRFEALSPERLTEIRSIVEKVVQGFGGQL